MSGSFVSTFRPGRDTISSSPIRPATAKSEGADDLLQELIDGVICDGDTDQMEFMLDGSRRSSFEGDVSTAAEALCARGRSFDTSRDGSFETSRPGPSFDMTRRSFDTQITRPPSLEDSAMRARVGGAADKSCESDWAGVGMNDEAEWKHKMRESGRSVIGMERPTVRVSLCARLALFYT
jgi:hypothetical protein